ncbi:Cof-type HAD-IIB family hydrolase [Paenibacillus crassostreae]|uniref:Hydrolase n=1 Tax=Paenibacillus crassostreae TaxID=1763538 RepID=A0A167FWG7_9BACL|nr:Cof-type HAD-IIB family hydrolase [Paenibacillus crassostreae]AOZ93994.1 hydrolase [Paenibacillus crassostreae]OAB76971.1 hydrolase [Paenibacillus crassostreae]
MKYKLIALDVDGTLLNDDHEISQQTKETIKAVAETGAEIILCTGRGPLNSIPFMEEMGLSGYVISHNGAATAKVDTKEIVHHFAMEPISLTPFMQYCREKGIHFDINTPYDMYVDSVDGLEPVVRNMYENYLTLPFNLPEWSSIKEPIVKFTMFGESKVIDEVYKDLSQWELELNMLRSGDYFIDLMNNEASKGNALKQLAMKRGIQQEEVLAIGNYFNDITMLTYAGKGIAMDNSPIEVKAAADEVTLSNNEGGVHAALLKHCLS